MRLPTTLLTILACFATAGFRLPDYSPAKLKGALPADAGMIVVSVGAPKTCPNFNMTLRIDSLSHPWSWTEGMAMAIDAVESKSDYPDHHGTLNAKVVKAGDFEAYATFQGGGRTERTRRFLFTVAPGETVYIGEFWLSKSCGINTVGEFRDQTARDSALFRTLNPALAAGMVTRLPAWQGFAYGH